MHLSGLKKKTVEIVQVDRHFCGSFVTALLGKKHAFLSGIGKRIYWY